MPLAHSSVLASPFDLPKWIVLATGALLAAGLAVVSRLLGGSPPGLRSPALPAAALFLCGSAISVFASVNHGAALEGLIEIASGALLFWGIGRFVREAGAAALLLRALLASATLVAIGSLLQVFLSGYDLSFAGFSILPPTRGGATLGDPGLLAQILLLAVPAGIGAAALSRGGVRLLCGAGLGVVTAALIFAGGPEVWYAGGAILAALVATRVARAALGERGWGELAPDLAGASLRSFLVFGTVLLGVVALSRLAGALPSGRPALPLGDASLLAPTTGDPAVDRAAASSGTRALLVRHPLGVGPGVWRHAFLEVAWTKVPASPFSLSHQAQHAGNSFLELFAETGVAGGLAFVLFFALVLLQATIAATVLDPPWGSVGYAAQNILVALGITAFLGSPFQDPAPASVLWVAAGLAQVALAGAAPASAFLRRLVPRPATAAPGAFPRRALLWALTVVWLAAAAGYGAWARDRVQASRLALVGQSAFFAGQYRAALAALEQPAVRRSPDPLAFALAGDACLRLSLHPPAVAAFTESLERSPWFLGAYHGRAAAYKELGRYDLAEQDLRRALAIWPDSTDTLLRQGALDAARGRLEAALESYRKVARLDSTLAETFFRMGEIFERLQRYDEAIEAYRICGLKNPRYPGLHLRAGNAYAAKGMYEMALTFYLAAAGIDTGDVETRVRLANTYNILGKPCEAKDALEGARDLEADGWRRAAILDLIAKLEPACRKRMKEMARGG